MAFDPTSAKPVGEQTRVTPTPQQIPAEATGQVEPAAQPSRGTEIVQDVKDVSNELMSAINRGVVNFADFLTTDNINAMLELSGSEKRVPGIGEIPFVERATAGGQMDPGLAQRMVRSGGELVGPAAAIGGGLRTAAAAVPKVTPSLETLGAGLTRQLGRTTAVQDVTGAALAGAGGEAGEEIGGEIGEIVGDEEGRQRGEQIGRITGSFLAPVSGAIIKESGRNLVTKGAKKLLTEAAPTIEGLKTAARGVYKEIDDLGATINPRSVTRLSEQLGQLTRQQGFNATIHPKVNAALREFEAVRNTAQSTTQIDVLRRVANAAAKSTDPDEARLGTLMVNRVDDFLDNLSKDNFTKFGGDIGAKYRDARQLWRRVKKTEQIDEAFSKARLQATGFENGIRTQFRQILNNPKKRKGFTSDEIDAMRRVVKGGSLQNIAKMIGRFGFSEGQASNMLMGSLGVAGGAAVGGTPGAVAVPIIGQVSRNLAQKLTRRGAEGANLVVRAGKNGIDVAKAYIRTTKPKERDARELTELLLRTDISLANLNARTVPQGKKIISDAVFLTNSIKQARELEEESQ